MDKTLKIRAYSEAATSDVSQDKLAKDQNLSLELEKRNALLEEEKNKSLDLLKTIVQLRESVKQEQAKSSGLEAKLTKLDALEQNQLARKSAELEEEKKLSLEYMRTIEQLRESIKRDQAKTAEMVSKFDELEAKTKELAELKAKLKEMNVAFSKISSIAAAGQMYGDT
jgi:hypothetical protein